MTPAIMAGRILASVQRVRNRVEDLSGVRVLDEEIEGRVHYLQGPVLSVVVDDRRRYGFDGLEVGQAMEKIAHVGTTNIVAAMVNGSDPLMQIRKSQTICDHVITALQNDSNQIVGQKQRRQVAFGSAALVPNIDSDSVFTQVKLALGDDRDFRQRVAAHDVRFSFGECLGERIPETGYTWRPTRQPILLDEWHPAAPHDEPLRPS